MGDISEKKIVLITCQNSVIVNGLENKLKEWGCDVLTIGDDAFSEIEDYKSGTDLFLYYLPTDALDDPSTKIKHDFARVIDAIEDKKLILIGEHRDHDPYQKASPAIRKKMWIDRPIDFFLLENNIITLLQQKDDGHDERRILIVDD